MSPYILIDKELEALADPATPVGCAALVQLQLNAMLADQRITFPEFDHYHERLNKVIDQRMEAA